MDDRNQSDFCHRFDTLKKFQDPPQSNEKIAQIIKNILLTIKKKELDPTNLFEGEWVFSFSEIPSSHPLKNELDEWDKLDERMDVLKSIIIFICDKKYSMILCRLINKQRKIYLKELQHVDLKIKKYAESYRTCHFFNYQD